jgi:hypothetical protein
MVESRIRHRVLPTAGGLKLKVKATRSRKGREKERNWRTKKKERNWREVQKTMSVGGEKKSFEKWFNILHTLRSS